MGKKDRNNFLPKLTTSIQNDNTLFIEQVAKDFEEFPKIINELKKSDTIKDFHLLYENLESQQQINQRNKIIAKYFLPFMDKQNEQERIKLIHIIQKDKVYGKKLNKNKTTNNFDQNINLIDFLYPFKEDIKNKKDTLSNLYQVLVAS